jgi:N-methylhydantoinase A
VIVPAYPGALSALGILISDVVKDHSRTVLLRVNSSGKKHGARASDLPTKQLDAIFAELKNAVAAELAREGWQGKAVYEPGCDVRYRGQGYELNLPYGHDVLARFHAEHKRRYGYSSPQNDVEIVTVRLRARVASPEKLSKMKIHFGEGRLEPAPVSVYYAGRRLKGRIIPREFIERGRKYRGPAVITEYSATTFVPPGLGFFQDKSGNLLIDTFSRDFE